MVIEIASHMKKGIAGLYRSVNQTHTLSMFKSECRSSVEQTVDCFEPVSVRDYKLFESKWMGFRLYVYSLHD